MSERRDYTKEEYALMEKYVYQLIDIFSVEMRNQYNCLSSGSGASMPHDIQKITVDFILYQPATIEKARELEIKATERFVEIINAHEGIRPYLRDYPWDHKRADVMISFRQENGDNYPDGIRLVLQAKDQVVYFGPSQDPSDIDPLKKESYEEAKALVLFSTSHLDPKKKWWQFWMF